MTAAGKWGYSQDGERYTGQFATREEAIAEGCEPAYVGQFRDPICEEAIDADLLIERLLYKEEDYCGDWAQGAIDATKEQKAELTAEIRRVFGAWLDRHGLRPTFGVVDKGEELDVHFAGRLKKP